MGYGSLGIACMSQSPSLSYSMSWPKTAYGLRSPVLKIIKGALAPGFCKQIEGIVMIYNSSILKIHEEMEFSRMVSKALNEPVNSAMVNSWQDMAVRWSCVSRLSEATVCAKQCGARIKDAKGQHTTCGSVCIRT